MSKRSISNLFLGAAIGASLGILFAPKKGKETRRDLKNKMLDLVDDAKELSINDVSGMIEEKITEIRHDLNDLDKEKVLKIAKTKCEDLVNMAIDKGTPVLKDAAIEVRDKTIDVMKDMIKKLESVELDKKKNKKEEK